MADFGEEGGEFGWEDGLHAVRESFLGLVMDFNEEAVGAYCDRGAGERENFVAFAGAVAGIDKDRKMAAFFYSGNDGEVQGVA